MKEKYFTNVKNYDIIFVKKGSIMPRKIITEELKQEIIKYYLSQPMTIKHIEDKYELSHPTVTKILKDIPKYTKAKLNNPNANERFFQEIDSEEKAYFLGLLISDGNVFKDDTGRQASISITLNLKDEYVLQKFKEVLNINTSITTDGRGCGQIAIRSDLMAEDLKQYGVIPRKSYFTFLPKINDTYMPDLIRGIFDGDGSIMAKPSPRDDGHNRYLHSISFCGSHQLMEDIAEYLYTHLNLKRCIQVYDYQNKNLSDIKIQNYEDMDKVCRWMYNDASIYLIRKKDIYNSFKEHCYKNFKNKAIPR